MQIVFLNADSARVIVRMVSQSISVIHRIYILLPLVTALFVVRQPGGFIYIAGHKCIETVVQFQVLFVRIL